MDIILDDDNDLVIENGDFVISASDAQHLQHLLQAMPGDYRHDPIIGANVKSGLNGSGTQQDVVANIQKQIERDGFEGYSVTLNNGEIEITDGDL